MRSTKTRNNLPTPPLIPAGEPVSHGRSTAPPGRAVGLLWAGLLGYALLILAGCLVFRSDFAMVRGNEMSRDRSLFTAVNAVTLTGFQQSLRVDDYRVAGQLAIFALTVGGSLVSLVVGGSLVSAVLRLPYRIGRIATAAVVLHVAAIVAGGLLLRSAGTSFFAGMFQAVSALANSGVIVGPLPGTRTLATQGLLLPLGIVGGIGITVVLELWDRVRLRRPLSAHASTVLTYSAGIYVIGALLIVIAQVASGWSLVDAAISGSTWSLNSRTTGLPFESAGAVARTVQWIILVFMMFGASPGSTAGGIKTTTLAAIARGTRAALRGESVPRIVGIAAIWLVLYMMVVAIALLLLLRFVPQLPADRLLFIAASAASNAGLSHDPLAIVRESLYVLSATMLLGKLLPLLILTWTARTTSDADVAVG